MLWRRGRDPAGAGGRPHAGRVAYGHHLVAGPHGVGVAELQRPQVEPLGIDGEHRDVALLVLAEHVRRDDALGRRT